MSAIAGCTGDGDDGRETGTPVPVDGPISVAPDGKLRFEPAAVRASVGDTVRWTFESPGHNVSARPDASDRVEIPNDAEPFASYDGSNHYATVAGGATFEHAFEVPGEYVYVCVPHVSQRMIGRIVVE